MACIQISILVLCFLGHLTDADQEDICAHEANKAAPCLSMYEEWCFDDGIVLNQTYSKPAFPWLKKYETITFPPEGTAFIKVTSVDVINLMPKDEYGSVTLTDGGPGHRHVTLYMESQRSLGFNFNVIIFARLYESLECNLEQKSV